MTQIGIINQSDGLADDTDIAYWCDAVNHQAKQAAAVWGVPYTPVAFYATADGLPVSDEVRLLTIQSTLDEPGALGYHDDDLGVIFARVLYSGPTTSITLSHEVLEELVDPEVDIWDPFDTTREQAREVCDRVEGDSYFIPTTIMGGQPRQVAVSNWLLPRAFGIAGDVSVGAGPFDFMGVLKDPRGMSPGGYTILRNRTTGKISDVFARARAGARVLPAGTAAQAAITTKLAKPGSRLLRRLRG